MIHESNQDIVESKSQAIVNTVNCVGVMGAGVALAIKEAFPWSLAPYKDACDKDLLKPGEIFVVRIDVDPKIDYPIIINLATKDHWRGKTRIDWVDKGLGRLADYIRKNKLQTLSMPRPGCGKGGLVWDDVEILIQRHLGNLDCDITIHHRVEPEEKEEQKSIQTTLSFEEE